jgi:hypothetical protein
LRGNDKGDSTRETAALGFCSLDYASDEIKPTLLRNGNRGQGGINVKLYALIASVALAAMTASAHATTIERTFDVTASAFVLTSGPSAPAAIDPVELNFTLIWDPSIVIAPTSSGLTVSLFSLPFSSSVFASDGAGNIALGRNLANAGDCLTGGGDTYCLFMSNSTGANPSATFDQFTTSNGEWVAGVVTVTASSLAVPEPSTWALMLIGFGGVGWLAGFAASAGDGGRRLKQRASSSRLAFRGLFDRAPCQLAVSPDLNPQLGIVMQRP